MPNTRSTKGNMASGTDAAAAEAYRLQQRTQEIQLIEQRLMDKEARLKAQEKQLRLQSEEVETERNKFEKEKTSYMQELDAREVEITAREKEAEKKRWDTTDITPVDNAHHGIPHEQLINHTYGHVASNPSSPQPKVSFREATESVPSFDGYNIPITQFTRACRRAREIVPPSSERNLTKLFINKLRGRAYYAVEDEPCDSVTQLIDLLIGAFGEPKTIDQYRGELSTAFLRPNEHVLDYISRVKDLRTSILDMERRLRGHIDPRFQADIDDLTSRSFCDGLPLEYRLQMRSGSYLPYTDAFAAAKAIAKRQEIDRRRYEGRQRVEINPIGRPLAHSTPQRYNHNTRDNGPQSQVTPDRNSSPRNYGSHNRQSDYRRDNAPRRDYANNEDYRRDNALRRDHSRSTRDNEINCRYCKNPGHTIEECRKRQYNNARKEGAGNAQSPSGRSDAARTDNMGRTRPVNPIDCEPSREPESQC